MVVLPDEGGGRLEFREVDEPTPSATELLIEVKATALNRADLSQRAGRYRQEATANRGDLVIAGLESSGVVVATGSEVAGFSVGDRVMAMCGGGYAERTVVDYRIAIPIPERLGFEEAAAVPVAFQTEHDALITRARFEPGASLLVTAASAAVAMTGVKIARHLGAGTIFGTVDQRRFFEKVQDIGVDIVLNAHGDEVVERVLEATDGIGVDIVLDHVGGPDLPRNLEAMAVKGRLISIGRLGPFVGSVDLDFLARKRLELIGVSFRTRTIEEYAEVKNAMVEDLGDALAQGEVAPTIDRVFDLAEAQEAQDYMERNEHFGKVILRV